MASERDQAVDRVLAGHNERLVALEQRAQEGDSAEEEKFAGVDRALAQHDRRLAGVESRLDAFETVVRPPAPPPSSPPPVLPLVVAVLAALFAGYLLTVDRRPPDEG